MKNKSFSFLFLVVLIVSLCMPAAAATKAEVDTIVSRFPEDWPTAPDISSASVILVDADSQAILYAKNPTASMYPASTTKLMTALLALENLSFDDVITFSRTAVNSLPSGSSHIGMKAGDSLYMKDCLYGLLLPSANEVANALAEAVSGSQAAFVDLMNQRAAEIGCVNTSFANPNGLQNPNHMTCAYDLYRIMYECIQNQSFIAISSSRAYVHYPDEVLDREIPMGTTNQMIKSDSPNYNPLVVCGKTGWTQEAGRCLVTYAASGDRRLICVVLDAEDPHQYEDTTRLLNYGFSQFVNVSVSEADKLASQRALFSGSPLRPLAQASPKSAIDVGASVTIPVNVPSSEVHRSLKHPENEAASIVYRWQDYPVGSAAVIPLDSQDTHDLFVSSSAPLSESIRITGLFTINLWLGLALVLLLAVVILLAVLVIRRLRSTQKPESPEPPSSPQYHMQ